MQFAFTVIADEFEELARDCSGGYPTARDQIKKLRETLTRHGHLLRYGLDGRMSRSAEAEEEKEANG